MPEDDHDATLRKLLSRLQEALGRSSSDYQALAVDKYLLQDLASAGETVLQELDSLRSEISSVELELEQEKRKAADARPGVDPCIVS